MIYRTYDNWKYSGYQVIIGSKSRRRNKYGTPLFSERQVTPRVPRGSIIVREPYWRDRVYWF